MKKSRLLSAACVALLTITALPSYAALIGVLPETPSGSDWQAYYDDAADLTWLADASASGTAAYWVDAMTWADSLNINGVTGWRLPDTQQPDSSCSGGYSNWYNCTGSEMGNLFYNVLGGVAEQSIATIHNSNYDLFSNIQPWFYWSATEYATDPTTHAWSFYFNGGSQNYGKKYTGLIPYAWAVHDGDVGAVPVPPSV